MSLRNWHRTCAYCGKARKLTMDHVPPKVLLAKPFPVNLPTLPACHDCNQSFKKDDEYTPACVPKAGMPVKRSRRRCQGGDHRAVSIRTRDRLSDGPELQAPRDGRRGTAHRVLDRP